MEKFQFSLEKVLTYRQQLEQEAKLEFEAVQRQVNEREAKLDELAKERAQMLTVPEQTLGRMQVQHRYLAQLEQVSSELQLEVDQLQGQLDQALDGYVKAQQQRKVIEKLRAKKEAEYQQVLRQAEQKQLDDLANRKQLIS